MLDNNITDDELDVVMATIAISGFVNNLDNTSKLNEVCVELCGDTQSYLDMLAKAIDNIEGDYHSKAEDILLTVMRETYSSVLKLSNSVN